MTRIDTNIYFPRDAEIVAINEFTKDIKSFLVKFCDEEYSHNFSFQAGQFVMVSRWGIGEVPISISSSPYEKNYIELCIKDAGQITHSMHSLNTGDIIGLRGPYGNNFPLDEAAGGNIILAAGGLGIAPIRSALLEAAMKRRSFRDIFVLYGARSPSDLIYKNEISSLCRDNYINLLFTVDVKDDSWSGEIGFVSELCSEVNTDPADTWVFVCGPVLMMETVAKQFIEMGYSKERVYISMERHMKCGVGKCGHCYIKGSLVCEDGPVFRYSFKEKS